MRNKFGIYVHIPYCESICPFCNFNVYLSKNARYDDLTFLLLKDLENNLNLFRDKELVSIHFGGGTPSLMPLNYIEQVISRIYKMFKVSNKCEIALEVNPYESEYHNTKSLLNLGINRLSVGMQSFSDEKLKLLGRKSTRETNIEFASKITNSQISNINFDFIFGVNNESLNSWEDDLSYALNFDISHVSTYLLTIEESTPFWMLRDRGEIKEVSDETFLEMTKLSKEILSKSGINQYEISNFSKESFESTHNLLYWEGDSYLGIGPGAHSSLIDFDMKIYRRWINPNSMRDYEVFLSNNLSNSDSSLCTLDDYIKDSIIMGLRLSSGLDFDKPRKIKNFSFNDKVIGMLLEEDLIENTHSNCKLTSKGLNVSNEVIFRLIDGLQFMDT